MKVYPSAGQVNNHCERPTVPDLVWTYERRRDMSLRQCTSAERHPGRGRRWRREVKTKQLLAWRRGVLTGAVTFTASDGTRLTWRELLHSRIEGRAPALWDLRRKARALMDELSGAGPATGWGIPQPIREGAGAEKWTPYYIPRASERCWRWWRARGYELLRVLTLLARWWGLLIPPHRAPGGSTTRGETRSTAPLSPLYSETECRDHPAEGAAAILSRLLPGRAM